MPDALVEQTQVLFLCQTGSDFFQALRGKLFVECAVDSFARLTCIKTHELQKVLLVLIAGHEHSYPFLWIDPPYFTTNENPEYEQKESEHDKKVFNPFVPCLRFHKQKRHPEVSRPSPSTDRAGVVLSGCRSMRAIRIG